MGAGLLGALRSSGSPILPLIGVAIIALTAVGCRSVGSADFSPTALAASSATPAGPLPTGASTGVPEHWQLEFSRSGGLGGEAKTVVLTDDGAFVATDERMHRQSDGMLAEESR